MRTHGDGAISVVEASAASRGSSKVAQPVVDLVSLSLLEELGEVAALDAPRVLMHNGADGRPDLRWQQVDGRGQPVRTGHRSIHQAHRDQTRAHM